MTPAALVCASLLAAPQPSPSPSPPVARFQEDVVVTAERGPEARADTPAAVSVLTRDEASLLPAESLAELLDHLPGFQVLFGGGSGVLPMVSARGFFGGGEAEYVHLLVDGVPLADVESGLADWRRVRASDVERVEALRGPASAVYGDTALGGVVQVFRRTAGPGRLREAAASFGSFGSWSAEGALRGGGARRVGLSGFGSRTTGFRARSGSRDGGADLTVDGGPWSLVVSGSRRDREDPGPLGRAAASEDPSASDPLFRFDHEDTSRGHAAIRFRREQARTPLHVTLHGSVRAVDQIRTLLLAAGLGDRAHRDVSSATVGGRVDVERTLPLRGRHHRIRAGLEASRDRVDTAYSSVDEAGVVRGEVARADGHRSRFGAFASGSWRGPGRLRLLAGGRWDVLTDAGAGDRATHTAWSPRVGLSVALGPHSRPPLSAWLQHSRAFKAATLDQLLDPRPFPDFSGGTFQISNPRLVPQRARTWEAGLSQAAAAGRWEIVAYRTAVGDEIDFDPATFRYRNIGRSLHQGLEASARVLSDRRLSPHVTYAWTRVEAQAEGRRGLQLKNVPEHLLRAGLRARLPRGLAADARVTWSAGRFLDDAGQVPSAEAAVVDLRLDRRFGPLRARLDALNLTDRAWEPVGYLLPDLAGGEVPYVLPPAPRTVRFGLDWSF
jgi:outer membrane receptor protein involved in Fe transport